MCRFIIRAEPKTASPDVDRQQLQRVVGDIIDVLPDGVSPGTEVVADSRWRVVDVPNMTVEEGIAHAAPEEVDIDDTFITRRNCKLVDLTQIETDYPKTRQENIVTDAPYFRERLSLKTRVQKSRVLGKTGRVL